MIARLVGVTIAGPSPWITRPPISHPTVGAKPLTNEPTPNTVTPVMNMPFRPRRSLTTPPATRRLA
jgi:hypothetical protein